MSLCRHFVRELRRSVLVGTPEPDRGSQRSSAILEGLGDMSHPAAGPSMYASEKEKNQDAQMSAFLRERGGHDSPQSSRDRHSRPSPNMSTTREPATDSNSPAHTVARQDIRASAEKILYTFLLPGAEREITLPGSITQEVTTAIEEFGRDDPEVFDVAKDYVFQAMERDAFPGFLRMKALGNLIPPTLIMRLILGLISMFGGFWAAFVLIFLNETRTTRLWVCISQPYQLLVALYANRLPPSSFFPLRLVYTAWHRTSIHWTQSLRSLGSASTPRLTSPRFGSPMCGSCWLREPSWSLPLPCSSTLRSVSCSYWFQASGSSPPWNSIARKRKADDDAMGSSRILLPNLVQDGCVIL